MHQTHTRKELFYVYVKDIGDEDMNNIYTGQ